MEKRTVLVVNENRETSPRYSTLFSALGYGSHLEMPYKRGLSWLTEGNLPVLILLDITQSESSGLKFLAGARETCPMAPIVVSGSADQIRLIVQALQLGASEYLVAPFDNNQARLAIERALENQKSNEATSEAREPELQGVFASAEMRRICEIAKMAARTDVPVLITGESGVGKEVLARFIHDHSPRANKPLIKVNCAALPNDLLESELFGYERGAFTGAITEKPGKFELANGGTILLDEIGEMSPNLQAKLLHVLQDGEFSRLGGNRQFRVDARVLASTNRKLEEAVANREFRNDLYFRLNVIRIKIPALRERRQEIVSFSNHFFHKYAEKYGSHIQELPSAFLQTLVNHDWPGNVRQLENVIKRYLILNEMDIEALGTPETVQLKVSSSSSAAPQPMQPSPQPLPSEISSLKEVGELAAENAQREVVLRMLRETNWNRKLAARRLNICYKALLNKIKKWQIQRPPSSPASLSRRRAVEVTPPDTDQPELVTHSAHGDLKVS
jgi:DNA-binding NtrC family response regulator